MEQEAYTILKQVKRTKRASLHPPAILVISLVVNFPRAG